MRLQFHIHLGAMPQIREIRGLVEVLRGQVVLGLWREGCDDVLIALGMVVRGIQPAVHHLEELRRRC